MTPKDVFKIITNFGVFLFLLVIDLFDKKRKYPI